MERQVGEIFEYNGEWYVNANMGIKEPYTEKQLVKLWNNHGRN